MNEATTEPDERLSSPATWVSKYVIPPAFTLSLGLRMIVPGDRPASSPWWLLVLSQAVFVLGTIFLWWDAVRLKDVYLRGRTLVISPYGQEVIVPLHRLVRVKRSRWGRWCLTFSPAVGSPFGGSIRFQPPLWWEPRPAEDLGDRLARLALADRQALEGEHEQTSRSVPPSL